MLLIILLVKESIEEFLTSHYRTLFLVLGVVAGAGAILFWSAASILGSPEGVPSSRLEKEEATKESGPAPATNLESILYEGHLFIRDTYYRGTPTHHPDCPCNLN